MPLDTTHRPRAAWKGAADVARETSFQGFLANATTTALFLPSTYMLYMSLRQDSTLAGICFAAMNILAVYAARHHLKSIRTAFNNTVAENVTSAHARTALGDLGYLINQRPARDLHLNSDDINPRINPLPWICGTVAGVAAMNVGAGLAVASAIGTAREYFHMSVIRRRCLALID